MLLVEYRALELGAWSFRKPTADGALEVKASFGLQIKNIEYNYAISEQLRDECFYPESFLICFYYK